MDLTADLTSCPILKYPAVSGNRSFIHPIHADETIAKTLSNPKYYGAMIEGALKHWTLLEDLKKLTDVEHMVKLASNLGKLFFRRYIADHE